MVGFRLNAENPLLFLPEKHQKEGVDILLTRGAVWNTLKRQGRVNQGLFSAKER